MNLQGNFSYRSKLNFVILPLRTHVLTGEYVGLWLGSELVWQDSFEYDQNRSIFPKYVFSTVDDVIMTCPRLNFLGLPGRIPSYSSYSPVST